MAEDSDLEKTEPASEKRLEKAREQGDVPRSKEMITVNLLLSIVVCLWVMGKQFMMALKANLAGGLTLSREVIFEPYLLLVYIGDLLQPLVLAFLPLVVLILIVAIASPVLIGGWLFSTKALTPNFSRLNPLQGIANLFSKNAGMELVKAFAKALLVGGTAYIVVSRNMDEMLALSSLPLADGIGKVGYLLTTGTLTVVCALVLVAVIDVPYQLMHYANKLKMTKEEVRQESKESEGNPEIKARIRRQQREMARRRMMAEVPKADVVITNPTHYAVAIQYKSDSMRAPKVVAKGADEVALKIREIAAEHHVTVLEAPKLARALYAHTELEETIPEALYSAVAEVIAYVFQMRVFSQQGGVRPTEPKALDVPDALDPHLEPLLQNMLGGAASAEGYAR